MDEQERVIQELERALNAKINPLKLAETRLENRKMRPHMVRAHEMFSPILNFPFVIVVVFFEKVAFSIRIIVICIGIYNLFIINLF